MMVIEELKMNETHVIRGKVIQIIPPEKHQEFISKSFCINAKNRFIVVILDEKIKKTNPFNRLFIQLGLIAEKNIHVLVIGNCDFKVGDFISRKVTPIYEKTEFLTCEGEYNLFDVLL